MYENDNHLVKVSNVVKIVEAIGRFALFEIDSFANLLVTSHFILSLNTDQFWSVQCKLEVKERNVWFYKHKGGLTECVGQSIEDVKQLYISLLTADLEEITRTNLYLGGIELYVHDNEYIGIPRKQIEMIDYQPVIQKTADRAGLVVDKVHIYTPVSKESITNSFIKPLRKAE